MIYIGEEDNFLMFVIVVVRNLFELFKIVVIFLVVGFVVRVLNVLV